jgi:hypothetical protein
MGRESKSNRQEATFQGEKERKNIENEERGDRNLARIKTQKEVPW